MSQKTLRQTVACLQMALCAALWSIAGLFIGFLPWHPMVIAGFRSLLAAGVIAVYMAVRHIRWVLNGKVWLSGVFLACLFMCFVGANKLTTAANAILLQFTSPMFLMLLSGLFLHTRFHRLDYLTTLGTLAGIALCCAGEIGGGKWIGNLLALCAGFFMAAMLILVGEVKPREKLSGILLGQLLTAFIGIPFVFFTPFALDAKALGSIAALGIFQLGIPYVLLGVASAYCPPLAMGLLGGIEPILNPLWVALFTSVWPGKTVLIGGCVVVISVTVQCIGMQRTGKRAAKRKT